MSSEIAPVDFRVIDGITIIRFEEPHIDQVNFVEINRLVLDHIDTHKPEKVLANLRHIVYLHSLGIGMLTGMLKHIHGYGGRLRLCSLQPDVHELLTVTHMHSLFVTFDSEKTALERFGHEGERSLGNA